MNVRQLHIPCEKCKAKRGRFFTLRASACAHYRLDCVRGHFIAFFDTIDEAARLFVPTPSAVARSPVRHLDNFVFSPCPPHS